MAPPSITCAETRPAAHWVRQAAGKLLRVWQHRGILGTARFVSSRICRIQKSLVFAAALEAPRPHVAWSADEELMQLGPDNVDSEMTPELLRFLGGPEAADNIEGLRNGDRLFVIRSGNRYVHRGYILFNTRETRLLGDDPGTPMIGYCLTSPAARGRGLYKRALGEELNYLYCHGYHRATIVTSADNAASRKGIEAAGFSLAWEAKVWLLLNLIVVRCITTQTGHRWRVFLL